jgi:hypothetical protein
MAGYGKIPARSAAALKEVREEFGATTEEETLRACLLLMLEGYERAMATLPPGSAARGIVDGSFGQGPRIARGVMERKP